MLLLEQFDLLHRRGSSHGDSRIIRYTYVQDVYVRLMVSAFTCAGKGWGDFILHL